MKHYLYAAGIIIQFFTVVPLHRTLPMERAELRAVLQLLPLLGLAKGLLYAAVFWSLIEWSPFSDLSIAFLVWLLPVLLTGGLHLDGWMDWAMEKAMGSRAIRVPLAPASVVSRRSGSAPCGGP